MTHPKPNEYAPFYAGYVQCVPEGTDLGAFEQAYSDFVALCKNIPPEKGDFRYAPHKWTLKEVLQHMIDTERIMQYRALRIARKDTTPLPGFDQDDFVKTASVQHRSVLDLVEEFELVRKSTQSLFASLLEHDWQAQGTASGHPISVRALAYIILGHQWHHETIIRERYLS